ncbi:Protein of uncharacterised function (DUF2848) [Serratia fonticola]|nr:Protein of uncharacterised function (DUF2848) [Serratia fonticola]
MRLTFTLPETCSAKTLDADIDHLVIAGWTGRDYKAIQHHIQELAELGVPQPSSVPLFYRVAV